MSIASYQLLIPIKNLYSYVLIDEKERKKSQIKHKKQKKKGKTSFRQRIYWNRKTNNCC